MNKYQAESFKGLDWDNLKLERQALKIKLDRLLDAACAVVNVGVPYPSVIRGPVQSLREVVRELQAEFPGPDPLSDAKRYKATRAEILRQALQLKRLEVTELENLWKEANREARGEWAEQPEGKWDDDYV